MLQNVYEVFVCGILVYLQKLDGRVASKEGDLLYQIRPLVSVAERIERKEKVYEVQNTVVCNFIVHKSAPRTRLATHKGTYKGKRDHCLIAVELLCMCHVVGR